MTVIAAVLIVALVASNAIWLRELRKRDTARETERERLLNRVLHPEVVPVVREESTPPDEEHFTRIEDDYDLVGAIQTGEPD